MLSEIQSRSVPGGRVARFVPPAMVALGGLLAIAQLKLAWTSFGRGSVFGTEFEDGTEIAMIGVALLVLALAAVLGRGRRVSMGAVLALGLAIVLLASFKVLDFERWTSSITAVSDAPSSCAAPNTGPIYNLDLLNCPPVLGSGLFVAIAGGVIAVGGGLVDMLLSARRAR